MQEIGTTIEQVLGIGVNVEALNLWQMVVRVVVVYLSALLMIRIGEKRFMGKSTAFDLIMGIIFGSVVSRAINGTAPFFPTLGASLALVLMHWLFSFLAFRFRWFGPFVKGNSSVLVEDGEILWDEMQKNDITEKDLMSALRRQARISDVEQVKEARLERSGDISVLPKTSEPKVLEVDVAEGVQTVRIRLD